MKMRRILPLLLAALFPLLPGCVQLAEVDSTADPKYRAMIGREYELREDFLACGVKEDYPSPKVGYVAIMPPPGLGGRYIVSLGRIAAGTRIRITGVVTRKSEPFQKTEYVVSLVDPRLPKGADLLGRIYNVALWPLYEKPVNPDAAPQLSERYFRTLDASPR